MQTDGHLASTSDHLFEVLADPLVRATIELLEHGPAPRSQLRRLARNASQLTRALERLTDLGVITGGPSFYTLTAAELGDVIRLVEDSRPGERLFEPLAHHLTRAVIDLLLTGAMRRSYLNELADRRRVHAALRRLIDIGLVREVPRGVQLLEPGQCYAILQLVDVIAAGLHKRGYYAAWQAAWRRGFHHGSRDRRPPATGSVTGHAPTSALTVDPRFERLATRLLSDPP